MDVYHAAERLMGMGPRDWARHASGWSVYTRIAGSIPVFLALWSVHWIGAWAILPIVLVALWVWVNPRLFPPPASADGWAARGVLGERAFLNRARVPLPREHAVCAWISTAAAGVFLVVAVVGLVTADAGLAATGWFASVLAKVWFVDRMAWLWDEMKDRHPVYAAWSRADWSRQFGAGDVSTGKPGHHP